MFGFYNKFLLAEGNYVSDIFLINMGDKIYNFLVRSYIKSLLSNRNLLISDHVKIPDGVIGKKKSFLKKKKTTIRLLSFTV